MKPIVILAICLFCCSLQSQSYFKKSYKTGQYLTKKKKAFLEDYNTYSVRVAEVQVRNEANLKYVQEDFVKSSIVIPHMDQVEEGGALEIVIEFNKLTMDRDIKYVSKTVDEYGQNIYKYVINYNSKLNYKYTVFNSSSKEIVFNGKPKLSNTLRELEVGPFQNEDHCRWWEKQFNEDHLVSLEADAFAFALRDIQTDILKKQGYIVKEEYIEFSYPEDYDNPNQSLWLEALDYALVAAENVSIHSLSKAKLNADKAIKIWTELLNNIDVENPKARYKLLNNLATIHYWMEAFDQCEKYANLIIENGEETKTGKEWLQAIVALNKEFASSGIKSRHIEYIIDVSDIFEKTPQKINRLENIEQNKISELIEFEQFAEINDNSTIEPGSLNLKNGRSIEGVFVHNTRIFNHVSPLFYGDDAILFCFVKEDKIYTIRKAYSKIKSMNIGGEIYLVENLKAGSWSAYNAITKIIHSNPRGSLLEYYAENESTNVPFTNIDKLVNTAETIRKDISGETGSNIPKKHIYYSHEKERHYRFSETLASSKRSMVAFAFEDCENLKKSIQQTDMKEVEELSFIKQCMDEYAECK